jgi:hypothetical protein
MGFAAAGAALGVSGPAVSVSNGAAAGFLNGRDAFGTAVLNFNAGATFTTGTVICYAIDLDGGLIWIRSGAAGNWNNSAANNPATGIGGQSLVGIGLGQGIDCYPWVFLNSSANSITANFGGSAFIGAVPAGFTSGWDDSVAIVTNMVATQTVMEQWGSGTPAMWATQVLIEHWASVADAAPVVPGSGDTRVMVLA